MQGSRAEEGKEDPCRERNPQQRVFFGIVAALIQLESTDQQNQHDCKIGISTVSRSKTGNSQHDQREQEKADHLQDPDTARDRARPDCIPKVLNEIQRRPFVIKEIDIRDLPQMHLLADIQKHGGIRLRRHGCPRILPQKRSHRKGNAAADYEVQYSVRNLDTSRRDQHPEQLHSAKQQQRRQQQNVSAVKNFHAAKSSS